MRIEAVLSLLVVAAFMAGCDDVNGESTAPAVLVTVNRSEITAGRLERAMTEPAAARRDRQHASQAIEALIDEELLVQEAIASGLDQDPALVALQMQASRELLARHAAERIAAGAGPVGEAQVREFYSNHPEWFAKRKLYQFVAFTVARSSVTPAIQKELDSAHAAVRVRRVLDRHGLAYQAQAMTATPEDIPAGKLPEFSRSAVGDLLVTAHGADLFLLSVTSVTVAPLAFEAARPAIEQRLNEQARQAALARYLREQRERAAIAYHSEALDPYLATFDPEPAGTPEDSPSRHAITTLTQQRSP